MRIRLDAVREEPVLWQETKNIEAVRNLLGQSSVTATSRYLNVAGSDSLNLARPFRI